MINKIIYSCLWGKSFLMKKYDQVKFLESRMWPLTLALGLIFIIVLSLCIIKRSNGFLIFLILVLFMLVKIEWCSISMMNTYSSHPILLKESFENLVSNNKEIIVIFWLV